MDPDCAATDAAFKPKCLGIQSYINEHPTNAEGSEVQAEHNFRPNHCGFVDLPTTISGNRVFRVSIRCFTSSTALIGTRTCKQSGAGSHVRQFCQSSASKAIVEANLAETEIFEPANDNARTNYQAAAKPPSPHGASYDSLSFGLFNSMIRR
jgi:hypothetical protein